MKYKISIEPREYQKRILETCGEKNCLVILPTGTGKTLIALMLAMQRFEKFPLEKVLILAPTRPLVEQHLNSFKKILPDFYASLVLFTGKTQPEKRKKEWQNAEFVFSTPQCIANDITHKLYDLKDVCLLVQDECHRCLKNYSYTAISQAYKEQSLHPRILGLTASPGSEKKLIEKICENLGIEQVEIRTRESVDVKPYLQELEFEKIVVPFPPEFEEIRQLLKSIYEKKVDELRNRKVLFANANKITLLECQRKLFGAINSGNKNPNLLAAVSVCAQAIKLQHALELLETQTINSFNAYMKKLFAEADEGKSKAAQRLAKQEEFNKAYTLSTSLNFEHPKLEKLKELVKERISENPKAKILVFAQYRDAGSKIVQELNKIPEIKSAVFVGQAKKQSMGKDSGLNQKEQKQLINDFSENKINILVATSIGEEGLDLPEVNEVIFYEPVPSAIRKIQRAGRTARLMKGSLKILMTQDTRDIAFHYASVSKEKKMHKAIEEIKKDYDREEKDKDKQKGLF